VNDTLTVRIVAVTLGLVALATVVGGQLLAWGGVTIPESLTNLGFAAAGALAALLANTRAPGTDTTKETP
jgi:hypothetical protein